MNKSYKKPPFLAEYILKMLTKSTDESSLMGDFEEDYHFRLEKHGTFRAKLWYWTNTCNSIPKFTKNYFNRNAAMLKNYLKIALRNLIKYKTYSMINVSGLALGIACCFIILLWVNDELSYDRFHENAKNLYKISVDDQRTGKSIRHWSTAPPFAAAFKEAYPEILGAARFRGWGQRLIRYGDKSFIEANVKYTDPDFFAMFSFPFISGNPETALANVNNIVFTESMAKKYFGEDDPVGKVVFFNNIADFTVTGVIADPPNNSTIGFDFLVSFEGLDAYNVAMQSWGYNSFETYVMADGNQSKQVLEVHATEVVQNGRNSNEIFYHLEPIQRLHLYNLTGGGRIVYVYVFSIVALFILLIACINFMNLTTARSGKRSKEVGLRKVVGARRGDLVKQFFGESILISLISVLFALVLVQLALPYFNTLADKSLILDFSGSVTILGLAGVAVMAALVSGSYPAIFLSSFQPSSVLKGTIIAGAKGNYLRKLLVIVQFSLSIVMIVCTTVVYNQLHFIKNKDIGLSKEHIVSIPLRGDLRQQYESVKNEMLRQSNVVSVTISSTLPGSGQSGTTYGVDWPNKDPELQQAINWFSAGFDYIQTFNIEMVEGRSFSREFDTAGTWSYILNETAVREFEMRDPVGKRFAMWGREGTVIGIAKDFNYSALHQAIQPLAIWMSPVHYNHIIVKVKPDNMSATLQHLETVTRAFNPSFPFDYKFLDQNFDSIYRSEQKIGSIINVFTLVAIFISCLGLFGLVAFTAESHAKEFGLRKVLGSSVAGIVILISKQFVKWVLVACVIAWPAAYYAMDKWLQGFAYRVDIGITTFLYSGLLALLIALITVTYQSLKSALANPVESLKYE